MILACAIGLLLQAQVELRGQRHPLSGEVVSMGVDGVEVEGRGLIGWDRVRDVQGDRAATFENDFREYADKSWRARTRLERGDAVGAEPLFEELFQTYAWRPGLPAANFEVERAIREAVDKQLSSRGFRKSDGEADLYVFSWAAKDQFFPAGVLRIEIFVGGMDKPAWRGLAFEVISISDTPKKRQKIAAKAVKQLFKGFVRGN